MEKEEIAEVFENDITLYLRLFCEEQEIEDIRKESQSVWNGALMYINRHVFKKDAKALLKLEEPIVNTGMVDSNCNAYDADKLDSICDYYIYLCNVYDKEISVIGFSKLTGISQETLYSWLKESRGLSNAGSKIVKKLVEQREESLSNKLVTGRQNPVGVLGVLNRHYQWNLPGVSKEKAVSTARKPEEIEQMYGNGAKTALPELPKDD